MKLVDAHVLIYAVNRDSEHHRQARTWLDSALGGNDAVGFAWIVVLAFLRLTTNPQIFESPLSVDQAFSVAEGWLSAPASVRVEPTAAHLRLMRSLVGKPGTAGNLVNDAHLAALSLEHKATVITFDGDFGRFEGVSWRQP